jgi:hypothetical protein
VVLSLQREPLALLESERGMLQDAT